MSLAMLDVQYFLFNTIYYEICCVKLKKRRKKKSNFILIAIPSGFVAAFKGLDYLFNKK
jgi:hypothetical protein